MIRYAQIAIAFVWLWYLAIAIYSSITNNFATQLTSVFISAMFFATLALLIAIEWAVKQIKTNQKDMLKMRLNARYGRSQVIDVNSFYPTGIKIEKADD